MYPYSQDGYRLNSRDTLFYHSLFLVFRLKFTIFNAWVVAGISAIQNLLIVDKDKQALEEHLEVCKSQLRNIMCSADYNFPTDRELDMLIFLNNEIDRLEKEIDLFYDEDDEEDDDIVKQFFGIK